MLQLQTDSPDSCHIHESRERESYRYKLAEKKAPNVHIAERGRARDHGPCATSLVFGREWCDPKSSQQRPAHSIIGSIATSQTRHETQRNRVESERGHRLKVQALQMPNRLRNWAKSTRLATNESKFSNCGSWRDNFFQIGFARKSPAVLESRLRLFYSNRSTLCKIALEVCFETDESD